MTIERLFGLLAIALGLAAVPACSKKSDSDIAAQISKIADEMCACKDTNCLNDARDKLNTLNKTSLEASDLEGLARAEKCAVNLVKATGPAATGPAAIKRDATALPVKAAIGGAAAAGSTDKAGDHGGAKPAGK